MSLKIYEQLATPPADALKQIQGGRLKGMTDINPQWRYEAMTSVFGICGIGWKYEVVNREFVPGANSEVSVFVDINLFVKIDEKWSEAIPGGGGSMYVAKERNGMFTSDEAVKMATTDALSTAMKMLGVAADIYRGRDGKKTIQSQSKYEKQNTQSTQPTQLKEMSTAIFQNIVSQLLSAKDRDDEEKILRKAEDFCADKNIIFNADTKVALIKAAGL